MRKPSCPVNQIALKRLVRKSKLSFAQLSERIAEQQHYTVHPDHLCKLVSGRRQSSYETLEAIALTLSAVFGEHIDPDDLVGEDADLPAEVAQ